MHNRVFCQIPARAEERIAKKLTSEINMFYRRIIVAILLQIIVTNSFAQLQPITSGVYHWNELPVKKDKQRENRKIAEGSTHEFEYFEIHASTQYKGAVPRPAHAQDSLEE